MSKFKDELFDLMLKHASKELVEDISSKYPAPEDLRGEFVFSPDFKRSINAIIEKDKRRRKYDKLKKAKSRFLKAGKKVAIAICILVATFSLMAFTIPPIRIAVMNFIIEYRDEYININLNEQEENNSHVPENNSSNIITYIPEGYQLENRMENESAVFITYTSGDQNIHFERYSGPVNFTVDGEDTEFEKIMISNREGYASSKNGMNTIILNAEGYGYKISSEISMDELKKMLKSIFE